MGMADPWGTADETWEVTSSDPHRSLSFEDSFSCRNFEKLPDSSEYLSVLERKLARIRSKSSGSTSTNPNREIVRGLTALRADRMRDFLGSSAVPLSSEVIGDNEGNDSGMIDNSDPVYSSWMMQRLFPERQALSEEEIAALLRFDTLALQHERVLREAEAAEPSTGDDKSHISDPENSDDTGKS